MPSSERRRFDCSEWIRSYHTLPTKTDDGGDRDRVGRVPDTVLAHLVRRFPSVPESEWRSRMELGRVSWDDGCPISVEAPYEPGRRLVYVREIPEEPEPVVPAEILHQDERILVADKPSGVPVTPSGPCVRRSLLHQVRAMTGSSELTPAHRIDQDTTGLVLFTQRPRDRSVYQGLFARREVHKVYEAIGRGDGVPPAFTTVRSRIERSEERFRWRSVQDPGGGATTDVYRVEEIASRTWRFRVVPASGRPHQIRLHLAGLGFPLLGDRLYPERRSVPTSEGALRLLAAELRFRDPVEGRWRFFRSRLRLAEPGSPAPGSTGH